MEQKSGNWECFLSVSPSHFSTPSNKLSSGKWTKKSHCSCFPWISVVLYLMQSVPHKACWFKGQPQKHPSESRSLLLTRCSLGTTGSSAESPEAHLTPAQSSCVNAVCSGTRNSVSLGSATTGEWPWLCSNANRNKTSKGNSFILLIEVMR